MKSLMHSVSVSLSGIGFSLFILGLFLNKDSSEGFRLSVLFVVIGLLLGGVSLLISKWKYVKFYTYNFILAAMIEIYKTIHKVR